MWPKLRIGPQVPVKCLFNIQVEKYSGQISLTRSYLERYANDKIENSKGKPYFYTCNVHVENKQIETRYERGAWSGVCNSLLLNKSLNGILKQTTADKNWILER